MFVIVGLRLGVTTVDVVQVRHLRQSKSADWSRLRFPLLLLIVSVFGSCGKIAANDSRVDCSKPPLDVHPKDCCHMPPLLDENLLSGCKEIHGGEHLVRGLVHEIGSCFIECAMNATGTLVHGTLDQTKILQLIATRVNSNLALAHVFVASTVQCFQNPAQYAPSSNYSKDSKHCHPMASRFISCMNMEAFKMCLPDYWTNSDSCNTLRIFIASCPIPS